MPDNIKTLDDTATHLAIQIIKDCFRFTPAEPSDIESCVISRVVGLQYISDLGNLLPEGHPAKIHIPDLIKVAEMVANRTPLFLKEGRIAP